DLPEGAVTLAADHPDRLRREAEQSAQSRLGQIELLRKRLSEQLKAQREQESAASARRARADDFDSAAASVEARQREQRQAGDALLAAWKHHLGALRVLSPPDVED